KDSGVVVWGLGGSDEVFYLEFDSNFQPMSAAPLPIVTGVDALSPYIDRLNSANTFFVHTASGLVKMIKSTTSTLWTQQNITLPPSAVMQNSTVISSYTTQISVRDESGRPVQNLSVSLTAGTVTGVLINHLYYRVGLEPIDVVTD